MKNNIFEDMKKQMIPSNNLVEKTKVLIHSNQSKRQFAKSKLIYSGIALAVCLTFVILLPFVNNYINNKGNSNDFTPDYTAQDNPSTTDPEVNNSVFHGFVLTVYAADSEDEFLTANYKEESIPTILESDVKVLLAKYSPVMNSVPGYPLSFDLKTEVTNEYVADKIIVTVDKGELLKWDIETGYIENVGTLYEAYAGETLYWSPLMPLSGDEAKVQDEEGNYWSVPNGIASSANITVNAILDGKTVGTQDITITSKDQNYYATMGKFKTN